MEIVALILGIFEGGGVLYDGYFFAFRWFAKQFLLLLF